MTDQEKIAAAQAETKQKEIENQAATDKQAEIDAREKEAIEKAEKEQVGKDAEAEKKAKEGAKKNADPRELTAKEKFIKEYTQEQFKKGIICGSMVQENAEKAYEESLKS